uniref:DNA repair protein XRCC2 n=1 Tax=Doryrhamphus excisus TaxID=161450 RepID=UPI0025ADEBA5|nr:DNA repair protein XRCC2 [Doryrhamphus excisus]
MSESGAQLFARLDGRRSVRDIESRLFPDDGGPGPGDVVELFGSEGTGKTELLYHFLCRCVLPVAAGGLEVEVAFIDADYSLDMLRVVSILDSRLSAASSSGSPPPSSHDATVRSCLSRLLVMHCSSSSQLLLTLHSLETWLASRTGLAILLIDSISAFYWMDRCEGGPSVSKQEEKLSRCSQLLSRLLRDYRISAFASCHANRKCCSGSSSSEPEQPYLCRPWQRLVTHRMLCSKQKVAPEGGEENKTSQRFTVRCTTTTSSSSSSSPSTKAKSYRTCSFRVTDGGVHFI